MFLQKKLRNHKRHRHSGGAREEPSHSVKKPAICEYCGKVVSCIGNLTKHLDTCGLKSNAPADAFVQCEVCSQMISEAKIKPHLKYHEKKLQHICSYCGQGMVSAFLLRKHINAAHTKEISYPCTLCEKVFYKKEKLKKHTNIVHLKEKKYKCSHCNRSFALITILKQHEMTHTGEVVRQSVPHL